MSEDTNAGRMVLADPQFGVTRILRPPSGFEAVYEGTPADEPIYLSPSGQNIDPIAANGTPGYDPTLLRGHSVAVGSRLIIWLPNLFYTNEMEAMVGYIWAPLWRLRNVFDFRQKERIPYHYVQGEGAPDTTAPVGQQARVPLPAAYNTIGYIQTEPTGQLLRSQTNIHAEDLEASTTPLALPKIAGGTQVIQQGILDPAVIADANSPTFVVHEIQAIADELIWAVFRDASVLTTWDFAGVDKRLADFLGVGTGKELPNVGVYVISGAAP